MVFVLFSSTFNTGKSAADTSFQTQKKRQVIKDLAKDAGFFKTKGYSIYGGKYYFPNMEYPVASQTFPYQHLKALRIPLKAQSARLQGADETGFVPIPAEGAAYFRAEYHLKDLDLGAPLSELMDEFLKICKARKVKKWYSRKHRRTILDKAKFHLAMFPSANFDLVYRVGTTLLMNSNGYLDGGVQLRKPRAPLKEWYYKISGEDKRTLVGIFNGTFHNQDGIKAVNGVRRNPGLIVEGKVVDEPIDRLATLAIYRDGRFNIGTWAETPRKDQIRFLRQNEYLSLRNGEIDESGAYPRSRRRFEDEILRSYLATTPDNRYFAYIWTTYAPPGLIARALQKIGFKDVMLLDIHPVIAGILREPETAALQPMNKKNSYHFVPDENEVVGLIARVVKAFRRRTIQWDHYIPLLYGNLPKDFLTVHTKSKTPQYR